MSNPPSGKPSTEKVRLFLSYGRADAEELAERLEADLSLLGFDVWRDRRKIRSGKEWDDEIEAGLRTSQLVVAVLTPHAVREESVCRDELAFARFACKLPIVPALADQCEPPFVIFRLDYIDLTAWRDSSDQYRLGLRRLVDAVQAHLRGNRPAIAAGTTGSRSSISAPTCMTSAGTSAAGSGCSSGSTPGGADRDRHHALLITGDPGIGKSAIVAQLVHLNPGGQVLAYHCCRADTPETLRPGRFIRVLAGMIASQLEAYASQLDDPKVEAALGEARCETDPASAFEEGILNPLHRVPTPAGGTRYILIDALDEALAIRDGPSIVTLLSPSRLDRLPGWLRVVATTRKEPDVLRRLSGLRAEEIRADEPDNLDDIERFLAHRLGQPGLHERLQASGVSAVEAIRELREKSGGNFLWAMQALLGLESGGYDFAHLDALPPGLTGLYTAFFERHFRDDSSFAPARQVFEVVTAALEPLTPAEIAAAAGLDPDYELPALLDRLAAYLPDRDGRRGVYHKSFSDWLTDANPRAPPGGSSSARAGDTSSWPPGAGRNTDAARRRCRPTPCATCLLNWSRPPAGTTWRPCSATCRSWRPRPRRGWSSTWRRTSTAPSRPCPSIIPLVITCGSSSRRCGFDIQFLARHPTTLFQCLWNRCWWYDCADAAAHYSPPVPGTGWPGKARPGHVPSRRGSRTYWHPGVPRGKHGPRHPLAAFAPPAPVPARWCRARLPPRAHRRGLERGDIPRRPPHRERLGRPDGAGVGRRERCRARLPPRAHQRGLERGDIARRPADRERRRGTRQCGCGTPPAEPSSPASAGTPARSGAWRYPPTAGAS